MPVRRNQLEDRGSDHLAGRIAEDRRGAAVPAGDDALDVLANDGVIGGLDDGREPVCGTLLTCTRGDIDERGHRVRLLAKHHENAADDDVSNFTPAGVRDDLFVAG